MRKKTSILLLSILLISSPSYAANPFTKLGRGLTNITFSFLEIPTNIQKAGEKRGWASGLFEGILTGTFYMAGRILTGAYDVITFPIPLPEGYEPVMKPAYVFGAAAES